MMFGSSASPPSEPEAGSGWRLAQDDRALKSAEVGSSGCSPSEPVAGAPEGGGAEVTERTRHSEIVESGS